MDIFSEPVSRWFRGQHGEPTEPQDVAWPRIKRGEHVLIHSPTGSGKTLAAFLSALDSLYSDVNLSKRRGVRTLYISPLKALGYDVERNLREPMRGIEQSAKELGVDVPEVRADVRTGDTPTSARARMVRRPPHILITTPESLYLILTSSRAREILSTVETVILDEIHTLCTNKRGVHLSITLERLEQIAPGFQRIGLSATQRPLSEVARLLGGQTVTSLGEGAEEIELTPRPVSIVDCPGSKQIEIEVFGMAEAAGADSGSIWPKLIPRVYDDIGRHDTTLVFTNSRRQAENTADRLNGTHAARESGMDTMPEPVGFEIGAGVSDGPFLAHHGSLSDTTRHEIEEQLKAGELPGLVGTSSLELGIDIGSIDLVVQLQSPKTVTRGLQRVGRAGHTVGAISRGKIYATHHEDLLEATVIAKGMLDRRVEAVEVPRNSLDVLAQQIVAAVSVEKWPVKALYRVIKGAYPYSDLAYSSFIGVVNLVSGHYPRELFSSLRARIHWDRTGDVLEGLPGTRMLAVSNGGAIVDTGAFSVVLPDRKTRIGELDEEFVFESGEGDAFMLGSQVWRVAKIEDDRVIADPAPGAAPRMPFWRGDFPWRPSDLSRNLAQFRAEIANRLRPFVDDEHEPPEVVAWLREQYPIDASAARQIIGYVRRQLRWADYISSHKTVLVETYQDSIGDNRIVVHSPFGGRINGPWSVAIARELMKRQRVEPEVQVSDDGIMFRMPQADATPSADCITDMTPAQAKEYILDGMIESPLFGAVFRQNANRALLLPSLGHFRRTPFWLQRLRSKDLLSIAKSFSDFPIILETYRDALEDFMDMPGLEQILESIQMGEIEVRHVESDVPSPVARALDFHFETFWMYQWDTPKAERDLQTLAIDRDALAELFRKPEAAGLLRPEAIHDISSIAERRLPGSRARTETELAQLLVEVGDLSDDELDERCEEGWSAWISSLRSQGRVEVIDFSTDDAAMPRWVAAELADEYRNAVSDPSDYGAVRRVVARYLSRSGPVPLAVLQARYPIADAALYDALDEMMSDARVARGYFTDAGVEEWLDLSMLARIQERTLAILRSEVQPSDPMSYQHALIRRHQISADDAPDPIEQTRDALALLEGIPIAATQWVGDVLASRVSGIRASHIEEIVASGEFQWVFSQAGSRSTPHLSLIQPGQGAVYLPVSTVDAIRSGDALLSEAERRVYDFILSEGVVESEMILAAVAGMMPSELAAAVRGLALRGLITADSWYVAMGIAQDETPRANANVSRPMARERVRGSGQRATRRQFAERRRSTQAILKPGAKWSATARFSFLGPDLSTEQLAEQRARMLLRRHGVATKRAIDLDRLGWDWQAIYRALGLLELRGVARRGYFVKGLPGVQFADTEFIDLMRSSGREDESEVSSVISAVDPAYVLDRKLASTSALPGANLLTFAKTAGTRAVFSNGCPVMIAYGNGARIVIDGDVGYDDVEHAVQMLVRTISQNPSERRIVIEEWNGEPIADSDWAEMLSELGFRRDYPHMVADGLSRQFARHFRS